MPVARTDRSHFSVLAYKHKKKEHIKTLDKRTVQYVRVHCTGEDERVWNEHGNETFDHSGPFLASDVHKNSTKQVFITMLFFAFLHIPSPILVFLG